MNKFLSCLVSALISVGSIAFGTEQLAVKVVPSEIALSCRHAEQRLLVLNMDKEAGIFTGELREDYELISDSPDVASVEDGVVVAKGNGTTMIHAVVADRRSSAKVTVTDVGKSLEWSFRNHVVPVLSRKDCNSGGCHGALAGKGGFRLSLRGYDPESDFRTITREARGRRIEVGDPGRSLVLTKPTTAVSHKGGNRLVPDSHDYRVIAEWISQGARVPAITDPKLVSVETFPSQVKLKPGESQRVLVRAKYSDGREEDVTQWAKFSSADATVATVDEHGKITIVGPGEGAITAWFSSRLVTSRITVPYPNTIPADEFSKEPRSNFIDDHVLAQLQRLNLKPSPLTGDREFIRRAYLDTIGLLPTPDEVEQFVQNPGSDKVALLAEHLLGRPEFVDYWTYKWSDVLLVNGNLLRPPAVKAYYEWIHDKVAANTPWDEFARELITSKGSSLENGATNFFAVHQEPEAAAENVSQSFLSLSINCAKCHNHPLEKWTNDQYYAFANLFARVKAKGWAGDGRSGDGNRTLYVEARGDLIQPRIGKPQAPAPLDATPMNPDATDDRRAYLAEWLTAPENDYFSRAIANRVWANFFRTGIVEPVDDLRVSNPPSNEALLHGVAQFLVRNDFDLKVLMRAILTSTTYRRSSEPLPENVSDTRYYSRYYPRRLMAEVLHDAIASVTEVPGDFTWIDFPGGDREKTDYYPAGTRAIQLFDSAVSSYFLKAFGRNERAITCECERSNEPSMVQVLHLSNGDTIDEKLRSDKNCIQRWIDAGLIDAEVINRAFHLALSRPPSDREIAQFSVLIADAGPENRRASIEDLLWGLMSTREFLFNH